MWFRCVSAFAAAINTNNSVGGASGWDLSSNLQAWATHATFHVGDCLDQDSVRYIIFFNGIPDYSQTKVREMPIDKSWMQSGRSSEDYFAGVESFLNYAYNHVKPDDSKIFCPCSKCSNRYRHLRYEVHKHLLYNGIKLTYTTWYLHGEGEDDDSDESDESDSDNDGNDVASTEQDDDMHGLIEEGCPQDPNGDAHKFYKLLEEAEQPLYAGCESYSNLSFVVNLMHIKGIGTMSNKAFGMLLTLLKNAFPFCEKLPTTTNGAKKVISDLGLHYDKIDACNNDCIIYYKEHANATQCPTCKLSRWKGQGKGSKKKGKRVPWKVLRYFPLTPRLQRLFMSSKTVVDMRWHFKDRVKDGVLRHPADSEAWKSFNQIHESFGMEPRNVRLGLAKDGFNPFGNMNLHYSIWPVLIYPYNLPPWMCMKEPYVFMTLLIPGPKGPCHDIDVYMRPLIDELRTLWEIGVETYDIYEPPQKVIRINTILADSKESGLTSKEKKRKIKQATVISQVSTDLLPTKEDPVIGFQKKDLIGLDMPHNDALVISIQIAQAMVD
ncbi:uncharacterized protein LOC117617460 [Prunus dulcis]|uniref:uncharacterized protein LOC117617460 n=1 Tax=Prunus dulcis TaxID=3755 RepID=UPI001483A401|nr:uncharacterized protein LOC117617460 [Prunus dulcis]